MRFSELGLDEPLLRIIEKKGITDPTEIQAMSIPAILEGKDVIAGSKTGSGKTLAFGAGIIAKAEKGKGIQAIVLTPTRELCEQVTNEVAYFAGPKGLRAAAVYGGVSIDRQIHEIIGSEIVVGTPGRVLDHLSRGTLSLAKVRIAVLDEADRMLDMGFIADVSQILSQCPSERQTLLFSATISSELYGLSEQYMREPVKIAVEHYVDPSKLYQAYYQVAENQKLSLLVHLLKEHQPRLAMVFCNTQSTTDFVSKNLLKNGFNAIPIHGGLSQAKRSRTLESFHSGKKEVLVCTDVASRGLHIEHVTHVYNYNVPNETRQYIHRIGRTARAGKDGKAITLLSEKDYEAFANVLHDNNLEMPKIETPQLRRVPVTLDRGPKRSGFGVTRKGFGQTRERGGQRSSGQRGGFRRGQGRGRRQFQRR